MREYIALLAVLSDIVCGYPAPVVSFHRRQLTNVDGLSFNGVPTGGSFSPTSTAVRPLASGTIISGFSTGFLPTGTAPRGASSPGASPSGTLPNDLSTPTSPTHTSTNTLTTDPSTADPSASGTSAVVVSGSPSANPPGTSPTSVSATGLSTLNPIGTGASSRGSGIIGPTGIRPTGTGLLPIGTTTDTSAKSPSLSSTSSSAITSAESLSTTDIASLSTQSTSIAGVTGNTELTTTDGSGHRTVVPFLFGCWFCGNGGLLLWGVGPGPGIYPPPTPPPFPSWPTITIGKDNVPTPEPSSNKPTDTLPTKNSPTGTSPSTTRTDKSSSSSCSGSTVTDYWVSCASAASGSTSSCSTYSSSLATGCSLTATTTTTGSSCTAPASVDSENLLPGEIAGPEYDYLDPKASQIPFPFSYTVAVVASTGIVGATPGSAPTTGPTKTGRPPGASSAGASSTSMTSNTASSPLCQVFQDPHNKDPGHCQCSSGSLTTNLPFSTASEASAGGPCEYSALPAPPLTKSATATSNNPYPFTTTDQGKNVIACAGSSLVAVPGGPFTYCDGSRTTISTGTPTSTPASSTSTAAHTSSSPSADCALWDAGWGWMFEVYNIKGWSTDGGDKLHHEEKGCGALTGWSWSDKDSGGQAYFNLPFFIKDGCVERAIASAGGPKISCKHEGVTKRLTDIVTLNPRDDVATPVNQPPDLSNPTVSEAYDPTGTDISAISHTYNPANWDAAKRSFLGHGGLHGRKHLMKRGCGPSKIKNSGSPGGSPPPEDSPPLVCNPVIPGVDECNDKIREQGNVGAKVSLFYTGWGATGAANVGGAQARKWVRQNLCDIQTVSWVGICDGEWKIDVQNGIKNAFVHPGMSNDDLEALNEKYDPFLKNLAQAFAETSKGDVYVFIPQGRLAGNQWDKDSAWGGWEYPALTRNQEVKRILRVDLDVSDADHPKGTPDVIWDREKGDPEADYDPRGIRGLSLPDGLPAEQVPEGWDQPGSL